MATSTTSQHGMGGAREAAAGGLTIFAAVMLFIVGTMGFFRGLMAILKDNVFLSTPDYTFQFDLTTWGWIHLLLGIVAVLVSFGLFVAMKWARVLGVALAVLIMIGNFLSIPYYPFWSLTLIAMNALVIWGLCVVKRDTL
ncbi:hypothetical protein OG746_18815 [Streptomyces sp. NBC_01016]|uniref:DUF7144 family membrane protein n=1 Tax=Streptomyces sp. NBC_01016 TaxID=2903720 RepID=UPI00225B8A85|nr:hypothetical protein [Streptomyces sp. NBC_01016]MCX4830785.1 hypothetical protein [Streptomyces sp. NBC_01016]